MLDHYLASFTKEIGQLVPSLEVFSFKFFLYERWGSDSFNFSLAARI